MAQSQTDACNSALQKLGAARIIDINSNTREARQCQIAYDSNRRSELRKYRWNFSIKRVILAPDSTPPSFDFLYQFTIPADCLRILLPPDSMLDWVREGNKILTNNGATLNLRYIADIEDVTMWDPNFYDMFAISLAVDICEPITNSTGKKATLDQEYKEARSNARLANSFERTPDFPPADDWWVSRITGSTIDRVNFTTPSAGF